MEKKVTKKKLIEYLVYLAASLVLSAGIVWKSFYYPGIESAVLALLLLGMTVLAFPFVAVFVGFCLDKKTDGAAIKKRLKSLLLPSVLLFFLFYVYLPSESFLGNQSDFSFTYQMFIGDQCLSMLMGIILVCAVGIWLKTRLVDFAAGMLTCLNVAIYLQFMFRNKKLGLLDGTGMNWDTLKADALVDYCIWGACFLVGVLLFLRKEELWGKIRLGISAALLGVLSFTLVTLLIMAPQNAYHMELGYMSSDEQFVVSKKKNVVLFILDGVDNNYFEELLSENPSVFDGFEDFTLYTNTCSVFDSTKPSITQMMTGMDFAPELPGEEWYRTAWTSPRAETFYQRFHDAGYRINGYSVSTDTVERLKGKYDNYATYSKEELRNAEVDRKRISRNFHKLSLYRILPMGLKKNVNVDQLDFTNVVKLRDAVCYFNPDFESHMTLTQSDSDENYLIVQHINGTHPPCDDKMKETVHLLQMMRDYMDQMKAFGVYEDAAILITADHGEHNLERTSRASTPIFLVKKGGAPRVTLSSAPIYHEDILPTLLDCAGLYQETDEELFGRSVFMIAEGEARERTWYDRRSDENYPRVPAMGSRGSTSAVNTYHKYTYTGDKEVLEQMVSEDRYTEIIPMKDNKG